ncbi:MAG: carbohydrate kinase family protein [Oscillospiraceae bacterium]
MDKRFDLCAIGECLLDVTSSLTADGTAISMNANPGGAPLNVLACASSLGLKTAFIGKLSSDFAGKFLLSRIRACGIDDSGITVTSAEPTTLAMVSIDNSGDRSFSFYREHTSDVMLRWGDVPQDLIASSRFFHFGSVSMTDDPSASATSRAAEAASKSGCIVSFDPNYRENLWPSRNLARVRIRQVLPLCTVVKLSEDELELAAGTEDIRDAADFLISEYSIKLVSVTCGREGAYAFTRKASSYVPAFPVKAVDTTGAGDIFWGAFITRMTETGKDPGSLTRSELEGMLRFANAAGGLSTEKKGAISSIPSREEIESLLRE